MSVTAQLEFELTYFGATVQHVSHYFPEIPHRDSEI